MILRNLQENWKRIRLQLGNSEEIDEEKIRDKTIRRLQKAADLAFKMMRDERVDVKTRHGWFKRYTDAVRTLSLILKAREEKDWENRLRIIEVRKRDRTQRCPRQDRPTTTRLIRSSQANASPSDRTTERPLGRRLTCSQANLLAKTTGMYHRAFGSRALTRLEA